MPRISAPTVAEHRSWQRAAILAAARRQLERHGYQGLTFPALAEATGLARTSIYDYFASPAVIVVALCEEVFPPLIERITHAVAAADGLEAKVAAYVRAQLDWATEDPQRLVTSFATPALPTEQRARLRELHDQMLPPLVDALERAGDEHAKRTAAILQGTVNAATMQLLDGDDPSAITQTAVTLALGGIREHAR